MLNPRIVLTSGPLTDVNLLVLAVKHAGRLVTLDTRIARKAIVNAGTEHLVFL